MAAMPMLAGVGLMMVCCSSSSAAALMMGGDGDDDKKKTPLGPSPGPTGPSAPDDDEADPSCSLQRGDNVQYGCGHVYQDTTNAQAQCGATEPVAFIWDDTEKSACGINRGDIVQKCSNYIYQKESDANAQCVAFGGTNTPIPFIPTEQQA